MMDIRTPLPPGWDSKVDIKTGKTFYIHHYTKTTTWDDPRLKNVPFARQSTPHHVHHPSNDYVVTQHGSPDLRRNYVYPSQSSPIPAFQIPGQYSPVYIPLKDPKTSSRMSPLLLKTSQTQESSLTNVPDTEESVAKISAMFPTVSDTHIRLLLKKYMKCIFPKAEETVILDVLTNSDNNIQKASDWLKGMGYERRDPVKVQQQAEAKLEEERQKNEKLLKAQVPPLPKIKTTEEKAAIKARLQEQYKDIMEQVITIALDSVQYDEDRANQILQIMVQEDSKPQSSCSFKSEEPGSSAGTSETDGLAPPDSMPTSQSRQSFKSLLGSEKNLIKDNGCFNRNAENETSSFKSSLLVSTQGANRGLVKGANDKLLLTDYVPWQGTNSHLISGPQKGLAKGPDKGNLSARNYRPSGPNSQLCKGAKPGLAKGSIFQQFRNIVNSDSRGK